MTDAASSRAPPAHGVLVSAPRTRQVGFAAGVAHLGQGRFARPAGIRAVDILMQEYEGTVTISPHWSFP